MSRRQPIRPSEVRAASAELVLSCLGDGVSATRAELASRTSLTSQALGPILAELVDAGRVIEETSRRSGPGRPPSAFRLHPLGMITIEVVVRFADVLALVRDAFGQPLRAERLRHTPGPSPKRLVGRIATTVRQLTEALDVELGPATSLDITVEGVVDEDRQIVVESPAWKATDVRLDLLFADALGDGISVRVTSNERALAERALETVQPSPFDLVAIVQISHQTRLLLSVDGVIATNRSGSTGLLAHFPIVGNDRVCDCGRVGCFGTVSSGSAVVRNYFERTGIELNAAVDVVERISKGDPDAIEAARLATDWLSQSLAAFVRMLQPDRLIFTGAVGRPGSGGAKRLVESVRAALDDDIRDLPIDVVQPEFALGNDSMATVLLG